MPKVSQAYREARRGEIVAAAVRCFARKGFDVATIQDIALEAGISHGALYRYFGSKDEIVEAVARRERDARARRFDEATQGAGSADALSRVLRYYLRLHARDEDLEQGRLRLQVFGVAVRDLQVNAVLQASWGDVMLRLVEMVRDAQRDGAIDPTLDPVAVARVVTALQDGMYLHQTLEPAVDASACSDVIDALLGGTFRGASSEGGGGGGWSLRAAPA